jgi:hypothetical protein
MLINEELLEETGILKNKTNIRSFLGQGNWVPGIDDCRLMIGDCRVADSGLRVEILKMRARLAVGPINNQQGFWTTILPCLKPGKEN